MISERLVGRQAKIIRITIERKEQLGTKVMIQAVHVNDDGDLFATVSWPEGELETVDIDDLALVTP